MIGTIGEQAPNGVPRETAITGVGEDNPLVMLLREMLGARLDHLDEQSEDFRSEMPLRRSHRATNRCYRPTTDRALDCLLST